MYIRISETGELLTLFYYGLLYWMDGATPAAYQDTSAEIIEEVYHYKPRYDVGFKVYDLPKKAAEDLRAAFELRAVNDRHLVELLNKARTMKEEAEILNYVDEAYSVHPDDLNGAECVRFDLIEDLNGQPFPD